MKWTEQGLFDFIEQNHGAEIVSLIKGFLTKINQDDIFFYRLGSGDKFPSVKIFAKNLQTDKQILGIEFYTLFRSEPGFHYWINLQKHEENNPEIVMKIRKFLNDFKNKIPNLVAGNPTEKLNEINLILNIIRLN